ncbi:MULTISPECIES: sulfate ABC transporter substrate-binding protein [unclassified Pseudofrankia]|uniref:sulfate ABC transporter substrate-binding protein n=1 Tax=unclassified Pseudofrankia TaxID=2994372 RepID=UPI0008D97653|nr:MULTISPECIES: sulfate ABC transporter substrate-binding protein [unclassified Pseudofrankia]MDT3443810.1 sulfate ABC transporter substrate-binding protein [Pseudofrankia sp. BMG5.37]OHV49982.1 sulfate ABC transporter substrate-binding protein [Pseudofrankia sp. BMG5.36]
MKPRRLWRHGAPLIAAGAALALAVTACGGDSGGSDDSGASAGAGPNAGQSIAIVGYSVPKPAYEALQDAFVKTDAGKGVKFSETFGASGTVSKSVASGQKADFVTFSLDPDMTRLVPKFVAENWNADSTKGQISNSVVVIAVRKGNPLHITGWDDLIKPDVKIVTPDPASSGSAKWNILAAYTHTLAEGGTDAQAQEYLTSFFKNVVSKPASGADATTTFTQGTGDVLISYENEAIGARQKGVDIDYVIPKETFLIENPAAVTVSASPAAKAFLEYAKSDEGQAIFASHGFRPTDKNATVGTVEGANDPSKPFPTVEKLTAITDLGGWSKVNKEFFDADNGVVTKIENATG